MPYQFINGKGEHMHTLDGRPLMGVTSILSEVYPPPLAWWGSQMALEPLGFITAKKEPDEMKRRALAEKTGQEIMLMFESDLWLDEYIAFLDKCYKNHDTYKKSKGKAGRDIHSAIETYIGFCLKNNEGRPYDIKQARTTLNELIEGVEGFVEWASKDVQMFLASEAHVYSEKLWVGGICDILFVNKTGQVIVGDNKPSVYPKHFIQCAAYGLMIRENGLVDGEGDRVHDPISVDGYCIFDYNKGEASYLGAEWVKRLEAIFIHTLDVYKIKDLTGAPTL